MIRDNTVYQFLHLLSISSFVHDTCHSSFIGHLDDDDIVVLLG